MEEPIVIDAAVIEEHKKEAKKRERKAKLRRIKAEVREYVDEHWQELAAIGTAIVVGVAKCAHKYIKQQSAARAELKVKDLRVYDTSLGHYWELKRKLTNVEWIMIETRRQRGERLANILADMNVLR